MSDFGAYRMDHEALAFRLQALEAAVLRRGLLLSDFMMHQLPVELAGRLRESAAALGQALLPGPEAMLRRADLLQAHLQVQDEIEALLPGLFEGETTPFEEPPDPEAFRDQPWFMATLDPTLVDYAPAHAVLGQVFNHLEIPVQRVRDRSRPTVLKVAFPVGACSVALTYYCGNYVDSQPSVFNHVLLGMRLPPGAPDLALCPERLRDSFLSWIGLLKEAEVGSLAFDGTFIIRGSPEAVRTLLTPTVQRALLEVAHFEVPVLEVHGGIAFMSWAYELEVDALLGAIRTLCGLHEALSARNE